MKTKAKLLLASFILACGGSSAALAASTDDETIAVAPNLPTEKASAGKKGDGKRGEGALAQRRLAQLDKELQLTADQKEQIKAIFAKEVAAARDASSKDRKGALAAVQTQIRAVLTPEQQAKFDKMPKAGQGAAAKPRKGRQN